MVPPTSIWTGAVYLEAAATQGMPVILGEKEEEFEGEGDLDVMSGREEFDNYFCVCPEYLFSRVLRHTSCADESSTLISRMNRTFRLSFRNPFQIVIKVGVKQKRKRQKSS